MILYSNSEWTLRQDQGQLICGAGADLVFAIDDVEPKIMTEILQAWNNGRFHSDLLSAGANEIAEQLMSAGIIQPKVLKPGKKYRFSICGNTNVAKNLKQILKDDVVWVNFEQEADFLVIFKTNQTFASLLEELEYSRLQTPHLLVDLAYHHTLSIGPLVFPGQTACLACLQGRITNRWGDDEPPSNPAFTSQLEIASQIAGLEIFKIINNNDYSLTQKTVVYDFENRTIQTNTLYKVPMCPICANNALDISGKVALPWAQAS